MVIMLPHYLINDWQLVTEAYVRQQCSADYKTIVISRTSTPQIWNSLSLELK